MAALQLTAEDVKTAISVAAFVASIISLYFTRVNWLQSNRPLVSAYIDEHSGGDGTTIFNLSLVNTGNRPATCVRLHAAPADIRRLLEPQTSDNRFKEIERSFLPESEVALLENGKTLVTSFGAASVANHMNGPWLRYGERMHITITYNDLDGRRYESKQPLLLRPRDGFGGGVWRDAKQ